MTFNDKVTYRRLRVHDDRLAVFSDKLAAREYVIERLGAGAVAQVFRVGDVAEAFCDLLGPFVLKANHGSSWVLPVETPRLLTDDELRVAHSWLGTDYGARMREWAYSSVKPLLYAEELLEPGIPTDYKFFVFDGRVEAVQVDVDRFRNHRRALFSSDWSYLGQCRFPKPVSLPARPARLSQMVEWCSILADDMDFLRVDLYDLKDRVVVGELTCYPTSGLNRFRPRRLDVWLGQQWATPPPGGPTDTQG